ncbi:efflux RND transporter periplasmic adaptor subunit [Solemya velum gill symbiont]|uniref:efflux RND transporter periplasmic adaptor subunit n=2 Tax=Solemya velum gill symbiont TaxID=2340 RepID=UPI000997DD4D|nr:efflux RND transporter periplasmic adaptor subunit [Solemya velum gill symbiont]OOZ44747.1 efflux transporter periplasmic adaptor subunit [Solemya velum gill symbiont]OOZ46873.1 efflux transporter periplasmic adaptor subunit [Solemya velum gill symbiont]OOZ50576.1 efflux transporter periplasmic adaptor subunit [Solemya velum gill symbiont]OOZ51821.1 efflux transporter periplasmic adaptor subunit [Solemya velum gill symbiont]OOZ54363.1 efflux transporter periplasmic adaptor subunit [Solemya 
MIKTLLLLLCVLFLSACTETNEPTESASEIASETAMEHAVKHLEPKYVCPMHPQIVKDEEGSCPICGMDLVPKLIDPDQGKRPTVSVKGEVIQSMGLRTAKVKTGTLWRFIKTVGRVEYNETRVTHLHPRANGWMETLDIRSEGEIVKKGDKLGTFYSPDILSAQIDYFVALQQVGDKQNMRIEKARNRLRILGIDDTTIAELEKSQTAKNDLPVYSPSDGVVTKLGAREGMYLKQDMEMMSIADLTSVWVMVDIYEHQIGWLKEGLSAEISVPAYPGKSWEGVVEYIYPELDMKSRTLRVRLEFQNADLALKPNMFAEVKIFGGPQRDTTLIPAEALITTGERNSVVTVLDDGKFQPVDVVVGVRNGDEVEILSGLKSGDEIVTSGQFLIDSESSLQASFQRLSGE